MDAQINRIFSITLNISEKELFELLIEFKTVYTIEYLEGEYGEFKALNTLYETIQQAITNYKGMELI